MIEHEKKQYPQRLTFFLTITILIFLVLIGRLWYLQILNGEFYERLAEGNRIRLIPVLAPRGNIYDRNGIPLVTSRPAFEVSLLSVDKPITKEVIVKLAEILSMDPQEIEKKLDQSKSGFEPIRVKTDLNPETVA
ncbi:penicillin-binding protein 2, partial [Selenomonadales bacterium OttesenSCG-928-I06]|nr:penicillin-binding protein 2 [Selenomonadales bacterium OttesenSCG-928-I06]